MTSAPPATPLWLAEKCGLDPALTGDLLEQYASGRSAFWLWRQALSAVVLNTYRTAYIERWIALRAVVVGAGVLGVSALIGRYTALLVGRPLQTYSLDVILSGGSRPNGWWFLYRTAFWVLAPCMGWVVAGWVVGRWHPRSMVMMFLAVLLLLHGSLYGVSVWKAWRLMPPAEWLDNPVILGGLALQLILSFLAMPLSILGGGLQVWKPDGVEP
jgi:hypothetical protein